MRISIVELVGKNALTPSDGKALCELLLPELRAGNRVEVDFGGVAVFASPFFNWGIARLLAEFSAEQLNDMLRVVNLSQNGDRTLRRSIENAKEYYAASGAQRHVIDDAVHRAAIAL